VINNLTLSGRKAVHWICVLSENFFEKTRNMINYQSLSPGILLDFKQTESDTFEAIIH